MHLRSLASFIVATSALVAAAPVRTPAPASDEDLLIDYREIKPTVASRVRLIVTGWPKGLTSGVAEFTVFGNTEPAKR